MSDGVSSSLRELNRCVAQMSAEIAAMRAMLSEDGIKLRVSRLETDVADVRMRVSALQRDVKHLQTLVLGALGSATASVIAVIIQSVFSK